MKGREEGNILKIKESIVSLLKMGVGDWDDKDDNRTFTRF